MVNRAAHVSTLKPLTLQSAYLRPFMRAYDRAHIGRVGARGADGWSAQGRMEQQPHIRVGVAGHRLARMDGVDLASLASRTGVLLDTIASEMGPGARIDLVTCLAEGADSIAAQSAIARGWPLEAVLPFPREIYADDFALGPSREAFDAELIAARRVFALDCPRGSSEADTLAYERAGRVVLAQCDVLVALWDGGPARGRGGTSQIVAEAVAEDIPVIHLNPSENGAPVILWSGLNAHDLGEETILTVARAPLERLGTVLAALPAATKTRQLAQASLRPRLAWLLTLPYAALLVLTGARAKRGPTAEPHPSLPGATAPLIARFEAADRRASEAAGAFRGAYVANFAFAALAVLVSLSGLVLPLGFKPILLAAELGLIGSILAITHVGNRRGWHRRWIEQRQFAERLRCLSIATRLGNLDLRAHGVGTSEPVRAAACAVARAIGLPDRTADAGWLEEVRQDLLTLVHEQRTYFTREAKTMHQLDQRMHHSGTVLFSATALVCIAFLAIEGTMRLSGHQPAGEVAHVAALYVTIATAAFPTVGAAIYGIRMQGDFAGVAERGRAMDSQLAALHAAIIGDSANFDTLLTRTRRATALLTEDLSTWTHTYDARPLVLPG